MSLPKVKQPTYPVTLPSTGQEVHYRPFTVKEENILLHAKQEDTDQSMINGVKQIINNCVTDEIDVSNLTSFDVELLFVKIRSKSVGEIIDVQVPCNNCSDKMIQTKINLEKIEVVRQEGHEKTIMLDDSIGVKMLYPTISITEEMLKKGISDETEDPRESYKSVLTCMDSIFDEENVYSLNEVTEEEALDWLESLSNEQRNKIVEFFNTMPYVKLDVEAKCDDCSNTISQELKGIKNFFT